MFKMKIFLTLLFISCGLMGYAQLEVDRVEEDYNVSPSVPLTVEAAVTNPVRRFSSCFKAWVSVAT